MLGLIYSLPVALCWQRVIYYKIMRNLIIILIVIIIGTVLGFIILGGRNVEDVKEDVGKETQEKALDQEPSKTTLPMENVIITSSAFEHNGTIPPKYTCDGEDINPPLMFADIPEGAKSLVLIMDDPDVPKNLRPDGMWDHWVVFNLEPTTVSIEEGKEPAGTSGNNSWGKRGYGGPCPPDREHRYFFKLYALDTKLDLPEGSSKKEVEQAMRGHVLAQGELIGLYNRPQNQ
jgi:Raf kinase inhibitor-like YbhB/YbcL family protein